MSGIATHLGETLCSAAADFGWARALTCYDMGFMEYVGYGVIIFAAVFGIFVRELCCGLRRILIQRSALRVE